MARIYISSTYNDLQTHREKIYHALRQMQHDVIAMEDYVATDQRPLEKCLNDVAACDLYVGLFAWRYGYIPPENNPQQKSITELEYRKAIETGKATLIFLLDKQAPWPPTLMDQTTGEGDHGNAIAVFREELQREKLVSFFKTSDELIAKVVPAVSLWEKQQTQVNSCTLAAGYHKAILDIGEEINAALALFSQGNDIYPDQCDMIHASVLVLHQPIKGLLHVLPTLPLDVSAVSLRYPLNRVLHSIEEHIHDVMPQLKQFQDVCRTSSRRVTTLRGEIQRKLGDLVKNIGEVDTLYKQLEPNIQDRQRSAPQYLDTASFSRNESEPLPAAKNSAESQKSTPEAPALADAEEPSGEEVVELCERMYKKYNRDEFVMLCTRFGTQYDNLEGAGLQAKMLHFIQYCVRYGKYSRLLRQMESDDAKRVGNP